MLCFAVEALVAVVVLCPICQVAIIFQKWMNPLMVEFLRERKREIEKGEVRECRSDCASTHL